MSDDFDPRSGPGTSQASDPWQDFDLAAEFAVLRAQAVANAAAFRNNERRRGVRYRAANPDKERGRVARWRATNPEKTRAQKQKARAASYNRPFVAIDSEGQNYPGADILYDGVRYADHATYLWGAVGDNDSAPQWLLSPETRGLDKKPLGAIEILDWLLDLPRQFGPAVFVMFSFGYDITQILKHLPYKTVWEIEKRATCPDEEGNTRQIGHAPVFWKEYAISYLKGKSLELWRLADPDRPHIGERLNTSAHLKIYDVFGFLQSSFSAVVDSMVENRRATQEEADFIRTMKNKRSEFASEPIEHWRGNRRAGGAGGDRRGV